MVFRRLGVLEVTCFYLWERAPGSRWLIYAYLCLLMLISPRRHNIYAHLCLFMLIHGYLCLFMLIYAYL